MGVWDQRHAPAALPLGKTHRAHCIGDFVGPRVGLDGCRKSRSTGISSPDRPPWSEFLYRLSYPGPLSHVGTHQRNNDERSRNHRCCGKQYYRFRVCR
jgi:hypothetical protein